MSAASKVPSRPRTRQGAAAAATITVVGGTLVIGGQPVSAAEFQVTSAADAGAGTLRQAVLDANAAAGLDSITFAPGLSGSTITLTGGPIGINDDLTITGLGEAALTLTTAAGDILYLYGGASLSMSDITLTGGSNSIAATDSGDLALTSVTATGSTGNGVGFASPGSDLTVVSSTLDGHAGHGLYVAEPVGGGGNRDDALVDDLTVSDSSISNNGDGGLYAWGITTGAVTLTGLDASGNGAWGVFVEGSTGAAAVADSTMNDNVDVGLAIYDARNGVALTGITVTGNGDQGVDLQEIVGDLTVTDSVLDNNGESGLYAANVTGNVTMSGTTADGNGERGVYLTAIDGDVTIMTSELSSNYEGGAFIEDATGNVTVTDSQFVDNDSSGLELGGGIGGDVAIERVAATGNTNGGLSLAGIVGDVTVSDVAASGTNGNGIDLYSNSGSVTIERTTLSANSDQAIQVASGTAPLSVVNSTLTGNSTNAVTEPVISSNDDAPITVAHSTITGNGIPGATAAVIDVSDAVVTVDHTVITDNNGAPTFAASGTGTIAVTNSLTPVGSSLGASNVESDAPLLGALADNGGATETMFPQTGSPVIDAGDPAITGAPATDQRGGPREVATIDIGSVEVSAGTLSVADATVAEDAGPAVIEVTRSDGADGAASVTVATASGTATSGTDFTATTETVSWAPGESGVKTVEVPMIDDTLIEGDETFAVALSAATGATISDGAATVTITDDESNAVAVSSLSPSRFVDTRAAGDTFDDLFEAEGKRAAGSEYVVEIAGRGGVPADAKAVVINVTAVAAEGVGFVTVHPCLSTRPLASSLNYTPGVNLANEIVAPLSADGEICLYTSESAHLLVDVVGFVDESSPTVPVAPSRYLDTRPTGRTFDAADQRGGRTAAGGQVVLEVAGRGSVPADAAAVIVNVTAVGPDEVGFVTVHPCAATPPNASSLNYVAGVNRANELIASVDADGEICLFTSSSVHLLVDVVGYVPAGSSLNPIVPARFLDTRASGETIDGVQEKIGKRAAGGQLELQIGGRPGVPVDATAVVINVTAVAPEAVGFVTVHPCVSPRPNASSLNHVAGVNGANELIALLDADGKICLYTDQATHLIVDVVAYLA